MREKLIALAFILCASVAEAQISHVQSAVDNSQPFITDGTGQATLAAPCTVGNSLLVVVGTIDNRAVISVEDDGSGGTNTYSAARYNLQGGGSAAEVWGFDAVCERAAQTITVTMGATTTQGVVAWSEFSGTNASDLFEGQQSYTDLSSPYDSANITTTVAHSVLYAIIMSDSAADFTNEADGWQTVDDSAVGLVAYKILTGTVTTEQWNPTSAASENANAGIAYYNGTVAGGASLACRFLTLLGVTSCR